MKRLEGQLIEQGIKMDTRFQTMQDSNMEFQAASQKIMQEFSEKMTFQFET